MVFYPSGSFHVRSSGYAFGSPPGSLPQKCDTDKYSQNLNKRRFGFFTHQAFSIFVLAAVPWGPILDPCCKSMILTSIHKIQITIVYVFLAIRHFRFSLHWSSLGVTSWILAAEVWCWHVFAKFSYTSRLFFLHIRHVPFSFLWLPLGIPSWILAAKVCSCQVVAKFNQKSFIFLPIEHFPFSILWRFFGIPSLILVVKVWSWEVWAKLK